MTFDQGIAAVIVAIIINVVAFFSGIITAKRKNDELPLLAIKHLCEDRRNRRSNRRSGWLSRTYNWN